MEGFVAMLSARRILLPSVDINRVYLTKGSFLSEEFIQTRSDTK
ncbi:Uncharacterised protein [Klebsiella oxytoca]|nr:Uncharacterised protein [Klebsiella oxytoca]